MSRFFASLVLLALMISPGATHPANTSLPTLSIVASLSKLKLECDRSHLSNESRWTSYLSATEVERGDCIANLKTAREAALPQVRKELETAKGEYKEMLTIALAALGDEAALNQTGELMLKAQKPAVRVCAARELRRLKNKGLIEPFKQALADPFKRSDTSCLKRGMIYPVRLIASDALVDLGLSLDEVRKLGQWWE